jgi:hypothetical protein
MAASSKSDDLGVGFVCTSREPSSAIPFNIIISTQAYYIRQLQMEQSLATEETPPAQGNARKREDLITSVILETLEELLNTDNLQTDKMRRKKT